MSTMKKKFKLEELDCANCAAKMENAIRKIPGVIEANISFMAQKLTLEADEERFEEILEEAQRCISRVDDGCVIVRK